ncbi:hypothetical protein V8G54_004652 [Vigna mungo]|uniref:Uncharacterized protein n=1 Tax=Vigna mungo TaxID=3915 RepID=A0AAQ3PH07_VIGMU
MNRHDCSIFFTTRVKKITVESRRLNLKDKHIQYNLNVHKEIFFFYIHYSAFAERDLLYSSISFLYASIASDAWLFQNCLSSSLSSFHFNETSALRVDVLIPDLSSCKVFLASLLNRMKDDGGLLGLFGSEFLSSLFCFFF